MSKIKCQFVSVWDGSTSLNSDAIYDPDDKTFEVIGTVAVDGVELLDREYLEMPDGDELEVCTQCHERILETRMVPGIGHDLDEVQVCPDCDEV